MTSSQTSPVSHVHKYIDCEEGFFLDLSIILPTYNEKENISLLIESVLQEVEGRQFEIIVVDDDSPDGTWKIVKKLQRRIPSVRLIRRIGERGLASALQTGISAARGRMILWMDCDFSHPPELIPRMIRIVRKFDVVVASRFVEGGRSQYPPGRTLASLFVSYFARLILDPRVRDYTSGFVVCRGEVLNRITLTGRHGEYFIGFVYRCLKRGFSIKEIPYTCVNRKSGESKTAPTFLALMVRGFSYGMEILRIRLFG